MTRHVRDTSIDRDEVTSHFNRILALAIWACTALSAAVLVSVSPQAWLSTAVPAAWVGVLVWVVLWRPRVEIDDEGVVLHNVCRTITVPWSALIQVDTKFALTLFTPGRRFSAWSAPAPGHLSSVRAAREVSHAVPSRNPGLPRSPEGARPSDLLGTDSGHAAAIIRARWARLQEDDAIEVGVAELTPVAIRIHWGSALVVTLLSAASLIIAVLN